MKRARAPKQVAHAGPTAVKVEHWARTPEGRDYVGGFDIAFVLPERRKMPWEQFGFEEANTALEP